MVNHFKNKNRRNSFIRFYFVVNSSDKYSGHFSFIIEWVLNSSIKRINFNKIDTSLIYLNGYFGDDTFHS